MQEKYLTTTRHKINKNKIFSRNFNNKKSKKSSTYNKNHNLMLKVSFQLIIQNSKKSLKTSTKYKKTINNNRRDNNNHKILNGYFLIMITVKIYKFMKRVIKRRFLLYKNSNLLEIRL